MKKTIAITMSAIFIVCLSSAVATAGAARRHTIEGFMLGTGAAILGAAIYNEIHRDAPPQPARYHNNDRGRNDRHDGRYERRYAKNERFNRHNRHRGYWEVKKIWVAPVYKKKWHPGHYNRRGRWVGGGYERFLVKEGYYKKHKVRVRH